ncbi:MAG: UDP-3-O-(3-hydroxymyristoyl)glucosamine N-acyltransferase [Deltaproteobacteria bacterium]|jgi:UDP-3-O-[3-hydroxymyristoyl] glucosamine N-acyltransferase|nr:UDP-3-O-(3-hydroxymyristoyl)glucosamine N-acyltransferase [Deltaproteobacteria bacterium]
MPEYTLKELAKKLGLILKGVEPLIKIKGLNTLESAGPDELSFFANPKYLSFLKSTEAAAVIVDEAHAKEVKCALVSQNPYLDFGRALSFFARKEGCMSGVSDLAFIHPAASLGEGCTVYPFVFVGARAKIGKGCTLFSGVYVGEDCIIGDNCLLYPNVVLLSRVELGDACELFPGVVLGADGFGFTRKGAGATHASGIQRIPQAGFVRLGREVSVGANTAIDRGALGPTTVGDEAKIDNLVQIGHNVIIGKEAIIVAQSGIAGSTKMGDRVTVAAQAGISGHLSIGDNVVIGPRAGVAKDVPDNFSGGGTPLVDGQTFLRTIALMPKFPEMAKRITKLENELTALKRSLESNPEPKS